MGLVRRASVCAVGVQKVFCGERDSVSFDAVLDRLSDRVMTPALENRVPLVHERG